MHLLLFTYYRMPSFNSCALVGNAQRLLLEERGEEIDGHDCVMRLNQAPTMGFERYASILEV